MKSLKVLMAIGLVASSMVMFVNAEKLESSKKVYKVIRGDSSTAYQKPGLSVDLKYATEQVDADILSQVSMELSTVLTEGTLKLTIQSLDGELKGLEQKEYSFELSESSKSFPLDLKVSSSVNGIHYLSLLLSVEGHGMRSFAIPVNIGKVIPKMTQKALFKTKEGEKLSISKAIEIIE